jgi:hypothetical protein
MSNSHDSDVGELESTFVDMTVTQKNEGGAVPCTYWGAPHTQAVVPTGGAVAQSCFFAYVTSRSLAYPNIFASYSISNTYSGRTSGYKIRSRRCRKCYDVRQRGKMMDEFGRPNGIESPWRRTPSRTQVASDSDQDPVSFFLKRFYLRMSSNI